MNPATVCPTCGDEVPFGAVACPKHGTARPKAKAGVAERTVIHAQTLDDDGHADEVTGTGTGVGGGAHEATQLRTMLEEDAPGHAPVIRGPRGGKALGNPSGGIGGNSDASREGRARVVGLGNGLEKKSAPKPADASRDHTVLDGRSLPPEMAAAPLSRDALVGTKLGEYEVQERIGSGGMGIVYKGKQPFIGKTVAIKVLRSEVAQDPEHVQRLIAEARAVNAIRHRGIIDIFGFGTLGTGQPYIVMEYLHGVSFDRIIAERGPLSAAEVVAMLEELLQALSAAHAAGVIHRDLKPNNLFLVDQPDGSRYVKILDFGLSKKSPLPHASTPQTRLNAVVGTPEYMAPEQARAHPVSPQTDLYSLGVVLFELLTGRLPFEATSPVEMLMKHVEAPAPRVSMFVRYVPPELDALVSRLLEKSLDRRPTSAESLIKEVRRLRQKLPGIDTHVGPRPGAMDGPTATQIESLGDAGDRGSHRPPLEGMAPTASSPFGDVLQRFQATVRDAWRIGLDKLESALGSRQHALIVLTAVTVAMVLVVGGFVIAAFSGDAHGPTGAVKPAAAVAEPAVVAPVTPPSTKKPAAADSVKREVLLRRIYRLERELQARTLPGQSPDPMAEKVLREQRQRAETDSDWVTRERVAQELDAWEERFLSEP